MTEVSLTLENEEQNWQQYLTLKDERLMENMETTSVEKLNNMYQTENTLRARIY